MVKKQKEYQTKKAHNSFNKSTPEIKIYNLLKEKFPDTLSQYRSDVYPFNCDFYIPSRDLYIEFNGSWTHGYKPFVKDNEECQKQLEIWREKSEEVNFKGEKKLYYLNAIKVWSVSDVRKREVAKRNNLNYLEFFYEKEFMDWFNLIG